MAMEIRKHSCERPKKKFAYKGCTLQRLLGIVFYTLLERRKIT